MATKKHHGNAPIGTRHADDGTLIENPAEMRMLRRLHYYINIGMSYRKIAAQLHIEGFRTRQGGLMPPQQITKHRRSDAYKQIEAEAAAHAEKEPTQ